MIDTIGMSYYTSPMAMGKRKRDRQPPMWVPTTDLPTAATHPFYRRLNQLLREHGFDDFAVSRERIRRIQAKALRKLRHPSRSHKLRAFLERE